MTSIPATLPSDADRRGAPGDLQPLQPQQPFFAIEWGLTAALWRRDMLRLWREPTRWLGVIAQPMIFWLMLGSGMSSVFAVGDAAGAESMDYFQFFFPGMMVMVILFTTIFATMSVIDDRQQGFLQQVLVAPGSRAALITGKVAGVATLTGIQVALVLCAAPAAGFNLSDIHWPLLLATFLLGTAGLCTLSFCLAWLVSSTHGYHALMAVLLLPLWLISGAMFPAPAGAGAWLATIMAANPMTYMVDGFRHALHGGHSDLATGSATLALAVLGGLTVAFGLLAIRLSSRIPGVAK